jgi:heme/copper-type cytochrome/quinol oxidase subunit 2
LQIQASTTRFSAPRGALVATVAACALLLLPQSASAAAFWPDAPNSPVAGVVMVLFAIVFLLGFVAVIGYTAALLSARRSPVDADAPAPAESSSKGALITGFAIFAVLAVTGFTSFAMTSSADESTAGDPATFKAVAFSGTGLKVAHVVKAPKGPAYAIRVNAQQYMWRYDYLGAKGAWNTYSYNNLVLPAGVSVLLDFTSSDAEAAWWVPQLGGSVTALPGYDNKTWVRADEPGLYHGSGTVVNGTNYASQRTNVWVVPPAVFAAWVDGKQMQIDAAMTALGLERVSGVENALVSGQKGAGATTAKSEAQQSTQAAQAGK